jgi:hypothetical protein
MRKKAVSPAHRRAVAQELVKNETCSQRMACRILKLARSTFSYQGRPPNAERGTVKKAAVGPVGGRAALRVSADCGLAAPGRVAGGQTADSTVTP